MFSGRRCRTAIMGERSSRLRYDGCKTRPRFFPLVKEDFVRTRVPRALSTAAGRSRYELAAPKRNTVPSISQSGSNYWKVQTWKRVEIFLGLDWLKGI